MGKPVKRGNSYLLTVSCGYDPRTGKQIRKTKTWKPEPGMTEKQIEKELEKQKVLFEDKVKKGHQLNGNIRFADFIEKWLDYAETQQRTRTVDNYKQYKKRTVEAMGHLKLESIEPSDLLYFYKNLAEPGVRSGTTYICTVDLKAHIKAKGYGVNQFCELAQNIRYNTASSVERYANR